ncbi:hypothetical protein DEU56DRAFT_767046 [Suillus clintonianus]|uniref:uncharacterized protein n=1 Tax=Suillus clintonianus TaxID=1904413 RepID=UPI001B87AB74|nr:uncharacterized protein DEU56DRAFT_767046 [Suillus clintonianus]KAG2156435.1 hypothetical protein DEU56DRAFT_767046 [Suillus clintonianus]
MANVRQDGITRACKCLNIRIQSSHSPPQSTPPDFLKDSATDSDYTLIYAGQDGLSVAHPQVTMRTRKMGLPLGDTNRCIRYTTLTCLLCQTLAYRVQQLVPLDVEGQEGPLLPTFDWVEQDILMSSCGWIEVHTECLDPDAVLRLLSSTTYSPIFNVAVPPDASKPPAQPSYIASTDVSRSRVPSDPILSNLRPLFPPAPFIPSHPVFAHLSSIATSKSQALRSSAEEQFTALIRDKVAEIEKAEEDLKKVVESLWKRFLESLGQTEKDWGASDGAKRRDPARKSNINNAGGSAVGSVSVRDFVPVVSPGRMVSPSSSVPRVSSLSASLATSAFHHPRALRERNTHSGETRDIPRSPPPYSSHPSSVGSTDSRSPLSSTSSGELLPLATGESLIQPFKRSMDEARDTAASFRYFIDMEAEMEMMRGRQRLSATGTIQEETLKATEGPQPSNASTSAKSPGDEENKLKGAKEGRLQKPDHGRNGDESRGKRKVTFDIKPDALIADGPNSEKNGSSQGRDMQDMIFDLDGESSDRDSSDAAPVLPFKEIPHIPRRRVRPRNGTSHVGLPTSLSTLRPTSLPAYASLQVQLSKEESTGRTQAPISEQLHTQHIRRTVGAETSDPQEQEILKLVAADTPSHRGAWRPNSRAWQLFVSRQDGKNGVAGAFIPEEFEVGATVSDTDESDDITPGTRHHPPGIPGSLPISIGPLSRKREPLSLASYQPKTSLSDRASAMVPPLPNMVNRHSASALRKASYAARDRDRSMDPGTLDFVSQDDEGDEDDESDDELSQMDPPDEARGRQRALKILEARSKVPAAGMWRSLA